MEVRARMEATILEVVDSHTGGEPTRLVVAGLPDSAGTPAERLVHFRSRCDRLRAAVLGEPRGAEHLVGVLLLPPHDPSCAAGLIFFNRVGYLGMCGHGLMGVVVSLAHLGRLDLGAHRFETPVGVVEAALTAGNRVSVLNVPARRSAARVAVMVDGLGTVHGDIAWGGNWFFLVHDHGLEVERANLPRLTARAAAIRGALARQGVAGDDGGAIDHIELMVLAPRPGVDARSFVLCPGESYDRSPCGTGTSAVMACAHADGRLRPGQVWRQESVIGSVFEACLEEHGGQLRPRISGTAHVTAEARLLLHPDDPFAWGIP